MNKLMTFGLLIFTFLLYGQRELKASDISKNVYALQLQDGQLLGAGAEILNDEIKESQFVLLGEEHFSPQISELTNILIPMLRANGFQYFAVETGPNSTKKMVDVFKIEKSLFNFNTKFYQNHKDVPIPFFDGKKDELFLKTAIEKGFKLWGLDQEFQSSHLFLIDELYQLSNKKNKIKDDYLEVKNIFNKEFEKYLELNDYDMFTKLLQSNIVTSFFTKCNTEKQSKIVSDILMSWNIYTFSEKGEYDKNTLFRMKYMKRNFGLNYKISERTDSLPKVFIKMGSMHLAKGKNWLGTYDLGNAIEELSFLNGTNSVSINCFSRYMIGENGELIDYLDDKSGEIFRPILELATKDKWILIETKPILEFVTIEKININKTLDILLSGFDYILLAPTKTQVELNYKE